MGRGLGGLPRDGTAAGTGFQTLEFSRAAAGAGPSDHPYGVGFEFDRRDGSIVHRFEGTEDDISNWRREGDKAP